MVFTNFGAWCLEWKDMVISERHFLCALQVLAFCIVFDQL